ncbi:STAS domain-containing protein, partial [Streptomyces microflavus]
MDRGTVGSANRGRLQVEVRTEGRSEVVTPVGELDHHTADLLREPLESAVEQGRSRLVVDCSRLDFC